MSPTKNVLPIWVAANAWREILTRIFEHTEVKHNVQPEWLVNPATNRPLKLDMLYPEIGVAVRLEGLSGKKRWQRPSLQEEEQERIRRQARAEVCQTHGVGLVVVNPGEDPKKVFQAIDIVLSRAKQQATDSEVFTKISQARQIASNLNRRIKSDADLNLYADLWQDRQYQVLAPAASATPDQSDVQPDTFFEGMEVEHSTFGPGVILAVTPSGHELLLSVDFIAAGQKTLIASLVAGKLRPR